MEHLIAISASFHFFVQCALTDRTEFVAISGFHAVASTSFAISRFRSNLNVIPFACGLRFANCAIAPACVRTQHFVLHLLAMSTVLDFRKCCALVSLFACGLPRLAQQRLLPKVNRVQRTVPVPTMQALLPANCSICRGSSSSVSAKKEKTRTKFVLIFLWCGLRKTNGAVAPRALHLTLRVLFVCYVRCA